MFGGSRARGVRFVGNGPPGIRVEGQVRISALVMGRWVMITLGKFTTFTAYASLAFVGAIVLGLL